MLCVFCAFILFLSVFFVSYRKDLVLLNISSRYITSRSEQFLKRKDIVNHSKVNFCINKLFIPCNTCSCCVYIIGDANIYWYVFVSLLVPVSSVFFSVCMISNQIIAKTHHLSDHQSVNLIPSFIKHAARCCQH